jgi:hypothetical protein
MRLEAGDRAELGADSKGACNDRGDNRRGCHCGERR